MSSTIRAEIEALVPPRRKEDELEVESTSFSALVGCGKKGDR